jgi:hypothetical protein
VHRPGIELLAGGGQAVLSDADRWRALRAAYSREEANQRASRRSSLRISASRSRPTAMPSSAVTRERPTQPLPTVTSPDKAPGLAGNRSSRTSPALGTTPRVGAYSLLLGHESQERREGENESRPHDEAEHDARREHADIVHRFKVGGSPDASRRAWPWAKRRKQRNADDTFRPGRRGAHDGVTQRSRTASASSPRLATASGSATTPCERRSARATIHTLVPKPTANKNTEARRQSPRWWSV